MPSPDDKSLPAGPIRLGIIHLLVWMAGCALVLAIYRATTDWGEIAALHAERETHLRHLAFGLAFGTALAGVWLIAWRKLRLGLPFPSQPGHWLLVMMLSGFVVEGAAIQVSRAIFASRAAALGWPQVMQGYLIHSFIWGVAWLVTLGLLSRIGRLGWWGLLTIVTSLLFASNFAAYFSYVCGVTWGGWWPGISWPFYAATWSRIGGTTFCLATLIAVAWLDRKQRDWLHWAGVGVGVLLGLVEIAQNAVALIR